MPDEMINGRRGAAPSLRPAGERQVADGLSVLEQLSVGALPTSIKQELDALIALEAIAENRITEGEPLQRLITLRAFVERGDPQIVKHIVNRIGRERAIKRGVRMRLVGDRRGRLMLLFVLMATTVDRGANYPGVRVLVDLGWLGNESQHDLMLASISSRFMSPSLAALCCRYYESASAVFEPTPATTDVNSLCSMRCHRAILALVGRARDARRSDPATNLVRVAGQPEFDLARDGQFKAWRRQGGPVVRRILKDLGYHDRPASARVPLGIWAFLIVAILLLAWSHVRLQRQVNKLDAVGRRLVGDAQGAVAVIEQRLASWDEERPLEQKKPEGEDSAPSPASEN